MNSIPVYLFYFDHIKLLNLNSLILPTYNISKFNYA